jgi:hypothetical protein|tara:strand:+ start:619 stop:804 length:186 start_codon:yes stop_codon:yes gene_type:complete
MFFATRASVEMKMNECIGYYNINKYRAKDRRPTAREPPPLERVRSRVNVRSPTTGSEQHAP